MTEVLLQSGLDVGVLADGVNNVWVLTVTFLIFFMHAGFAMLEAGQVRAKNVANQLTKNMLTWSLGVVAFFLVGAAVSTIVAGLTISKVVLGWPLWAGAVAVMGTMLLKGHTPIDPDDDLVQPVDRGEPAR